MTEETIRALVLFGAGCCAGYSVGMIQLAMNARRYAADVMRLAADVTRAARGQEVESE